MTEGKCQNRQLPPLRLRSGRCVSSQSVSVDSTGSAEGQTMRLGEAAFYLPPVEISPRLGNAARFGPVAVETGYVDCTLDKDDTCRTWTAESALRKSVQVLEENIKVSKPNQVNQASPFSRASGKKPELLAQLRKAATIQASLIFLRDCWIAIDDSCLLLNTHQSLLVRCEKWKNKSQSAEDDHSWSVLTEDEITSLAVWIQKQGDHWRRLEARLAATPLLHPLPELLKLHLPRVKSELCKYRVQTLFLTQELIGLVLKLALRSSSLPNQWLSSVLHWCGTFNQALSSCGDVHYSCLRPTSNHSDPWLAVRAVGSVLTHISASSLTQLIARQRAARFTSIWCEKVFQPIVPLPEHMCIGTQAVQWLPKVSELSYWTARTPSPSIAETSGYQSGTTGTAGPLVNVINASQLGDLQAVFTNEEIYIRHWLKEIHSAGDLVAYDTPCRSSRRRINPTSSVAAENMNLGLMSGYMDLYQDALQGRVHSELSNLRFGECADHPGSTVFWPEALLLHVADKSETLSHCHDGSRPSFVLRAVALQLRLKAALCSWELNFHQALSACADHRCPLLLSAETTVGTKAGHLIGSSLQPLLALLPHFQHNGKGHPHDLAETAILPRLEATLKLVLWWLDGRVQQLLALWQVGQYLLITHSDLKHLVDLLKHLSAVCPTTLGSLTHPVPLEWRFHVYLVSGWWDNINNMTTQIQNIASTSIQQFYRSCNHMAADAIAAHMPHGKLWKRKYRMHGPPSAHNSYVDEVISTVLWPVLEGVKHLSMPVQISVVSMATKAFCEAWMAHICKRKIKFSLYGAQLLRLDFLQLTSWLQRLPELSVEARQSIQALDILRRLHGASLLLMRQPRSNQRFRKTKVSPAISVADVSGAEADRNDSQSPIEDTSLSDSLTDEDFVPNKEEWLSLRVHGGPPRWHALWCLALPCD